MPLKCFICKKTEFPSLNSFRDHMNGHCPPSPMPCGVESCDISFTLVKSVVHHIELYHQDWNTIGREPSRNVLPCNDIGDSVNDETAGANANGPQRDDSGESSNNDVVGAEETNIIDSEADKPVAMPTLDESLLQFVCELGKNPTVTDATIDEVMDHTANLISNVAAILTNDISSLGNCAVDTSSVQDVVTSRFSEVSETISSLRTARHRKIYLKERGLYSKPEQYVIGGPIYEAKEDDDGNVTNIARYDYVSSISIEETLQKVLSNPTIQEKLIWPHGGDSEFVEHCFDGEHIKNLFKKIRKPFLVIELYYDDIQPANPLGSKASANKIGNFYICLRNLPNYFNSCGANIHLVTVGYSSDFKDAGYEVIMEHIWTELAELENGIDVELTHGSLTGKHTLPVVLGAVVGDNLALHQALGFKQGFTATRFCHNCLISLEEFRSSPNSIDFPVRDRVEHDTIAKSLTTATSKEYGINMACPLNNLKYFHVTENYVGDLMHDFLEGVVPMELGLILHQLVYVDKLFSLETLNHQIATFPYGRGCKSTKPSPLSATHLRASQLTKQYASQNSTLLRLLPLMIGHLVPGNNKYFDQLLDLHDIWSLLASPVICREFISGFRDSWMAHIASFQLLFPDIDPTPKWHFIQHYFKIMEQMGPMYHLMCMRYETKNGFFAKAAKTMGCYKCVHFTLADRSQRTGSFHILSNAFNRDVLRVGPGLAVPHDLVSQIFQSPLSSSEPLSASSFVEYRGTLYHRKDHVVFAVNQDDGSPTFGRIEAILQQNSVWYLVVKLFIVVNYCPHLRCYKVSPNGMIRVVKVSKLKYYEVHDAYRGDHVFFIPRKYHYLAQ